MPEILDDGEWGKRRDYVGQVYMKKKGGEEKNKIDGVEGKMMGKKRQPGGGKNGVKDFRHAEARRKNNPPAGIAPTYESRERQTRSYAYDPHLDPFVEVSQ